MGPPPDAGGSLEVHTYTQRISLLPSRWHPLRRWRVRRWLKRGRRMAALVDDSLARKLREAEDRAFLEGDGMARP